MKAVTIRLNGALISYGPDNGKYDPVVPVDAVKAIEPDYDTVKAEFLATRPSPPDRDAAKAQLKNAKNLTDVINALQNLL